MKIKNVALRTALCAMLCAQAAAVAWLEGLLPSFAWLPPGAKPGFSNVITMFAAGSLGLPYAMSVTAVKALFAFVTRGAMAGAMSFAGSAASTLLMWFLLRMKKQRLGYIGISVSCAVVHNLAQLCVAAVMTGTQKIFYYTPVLGLVAIITGTVTGIIFKAVMPALEKQKKYS